MTTVRLKTANWYVKMIIGVLFVGIIGWYTYHQSSNFLRGPIVTIDTPQSGMLISDPLVTVRGSAEHVSAISLNGEPIFIDEDGRFSERILLSRGPNIITVTARDTFKREVKKTVELIYD